MLQIESHPYLTQERLLRAAAQYEMAVTAFSPLGALSYLELDMADAGESVLEQAAVKETAARVDRTPAQVVLRWGIQRGTAVIPKTSRLERLRENQQLFDFDFHELVRLLQNVFFSGDLLNLFLQRRIRRVNI